MPILPRILLIAIYFLALYALIFSKNGLRLIWIILFALLLAAAIYLLNPYNRIYSYHGFIHTAIVYQILSGDIPPHNPFLSGMPLFYYWGYHFLAAGITKILDISPFFSFALINTAAFLFAILLVYKISRLLIKDAASNSFSALICLLGTSIIAHTGVPVFEKITNSNGIPLGLTFFLLFLFSTIKILEVKKPGFFPLLFFVSILGCGFFYPGMLIGILVSVALLTFTSIITYRNGKSLLNFKRNILMLGILSLSLIILAPYLSSVSRGIRMATIFFGVNPTLKNISTYLILNMPLLTIIYLNRGFLKNTVNKQAASILITVVLATGCAYIFIHAPLGNEYKSLILSLVTTGILAGVAFNIMRQRLNRLIMLSIIFLFFLPSYREIEYKLTRKCGASDIFLVENGASLLHKNKEEEELSRWIRQNTHKDSVFIDSELTLPVFTQRRLFIGVGDWKQPGYTTNFLSLVWCYDIGLLVKRRTIVQDIYNSNKKPINQETRDFLRSNKDVYVVLRTKGLADKLNDSEFIEVFRSTQGNFHLYKPRVL